MNDLIEFDDFRFDTGTLDLEYLGQRVALPSKALETLKVLVESPGELISRERLLAAVWDGAFVEDANLTVAISGLRRAFQELNVELDYVQTVPRRGYRFIGKARRTAEVIDTSPIIVESRSIETLTLERTRGSRWGRLPTLLGIAAVLIVMVGAFAGYRSRAVTRSASSSLLQGEALLKERAVCESVPYFRQAVNDNADAARSYAGLGTALAMCGDTTSESESAVAAALAADPNSSQALAADGFLKMYRRWQWDAAETSLRQAIVADPNNAEAHHWLACNLTLRGRSREALGEINRAIDIEPNSTLLRADYGQMFYFQQGADQAIGVYRELLAKDARLSFLTRYLRDAY
ncbi:MAG: winged helix-turn-helix domain-containing protein, partial [Acidobacteria bacterium]|nr:winged helix-turn-helix domain-containing protein [Acidobacteriota bacterium]